MLFDKLQHIVYYRYKTTAQMPLLCQYYILFISFNLTYF